MWSVSLTNMKPKKRQKMKLVSGLLMVQPVAAFVFLLALSHAAPKPASVSRIAAQVGLESEIRQHQADPNANFETTRRMFNVYFERDQRLRTLYVAACAWFGFTGLVMLFCMERMERQMVEEAD